MARYLLVNPWIYDFCAYDSGIKPLGLLRIAEYLRRSGDETYLIDCLDGSRVHIEKTGFAKIRKEKVEKPAILRPVSRPYFRYGISTAEFISRIRSMPRPDKIFVTSGMTYWYPGVQDVIVCLKKHFKGVPVLLGGIYATLCPAHALQYSGADAIWQGDYLEKRCFLEGDLYPAFDLLHDREILPLQLTRGCPFRCSYCASRILSHSFVMKDPINLFEEVMYYRRNYGTRNFVFYDDALTYKAGRGIKRFLRLVIAAERGLTFQTPNGLHARFIDEELAELFKRANFREVRIALETSDEEIQRHTGGKVSNNDLKRALRNLREAGFDSKDLGVYILAGSPWLDIEETLKDIYFVNSLGARAILASYSPIPGTKDYRFLLKEGIISRKTDPLWHNKTVFPELLRPEYSEDIQKLRRITSELNRII